MNPIASPSPCTHAAPVLHLITPTQPTHGNYQSTEVEDDLTADDQTITTLASRMSLLENNLSQITTSLNLMSNAMQASMRNSSSETPASHEGAGAAP